MADNNVDELVASLVEAFQKFKIALSQAEALYQAALQHGIIPDLAYVNIALQNLRAARENLAKVSEYVRACNERPEQERAPQVDVAGPSSSQPDPVEQDVVDASQEQKSDASLQELERIMTAPNESVDRNKAVLEGSVEHKATLEEPVEQNSAATEETAKNTATSEETLERNTASPEETVERDMASQEEAAEDDTIAPEEPKKAI